MTVDRRSGKVKSIIEYYGTDSTHRLIHSLAKMEHRHIQDGIRVSDDDPSYSLVLSDDISDLRRDINYKIGELVVLFAVLAWKADGERPVWDFSS